MQRDYKSIREVCKSYTRISAEVIDEKLMYYADEKEKLARKIKERLKRYNHIIMNWPDSYVRLIIAQLIVHQIFKKNGLIHKYNHHAFVKSFSTSQQEFLLDQSKSPWRYVFSRIISNPEPDFYEMEDIFGEEIFLFYSPSLKETLHQYSPNFWLLFIGFNGFCWQSSGLNIPLVNITQDDIFYFATEINSNIEDEFDIIQDLEDNPLPYLMMIDLGASPTIVHKKHLISHWSAQNRIVDVKFDEANLRRTFLLAWNRDVFELKLKRYSGFPHYAVAYYDEVHETIFRYANTEDGFYKITQALKKEGFPLLDQADVNLSFKMHNFLESMLKKEIDLNPYAALFEIEEDQDMEIEEDESEALESLRKFMNIVIHKHNNNEQVDVDFIAMQVGANPEMARKIWKNFKRTLNGL